MKNEEFERLPWLLSRKEVLRLTGLSPYELHQYVETGVLHRHVACKKGRYFRVEIQQLCRIATNK
jgi:DNA-binding transcriptional MerR regulator